MSRSYYSQALATEQPLDGRLEPADRGYWAKLESQGCWLGSKPAKHSKTSPSSPYCVEDFHENRESLEPMPQALRSAELSDLSSRDITPSSSRNHEDAVQSQTPPSPPPAAALSPKKQTSSAVVLDKKKAPPRVHGNPFIEASKLKPSGKEGGEVPLKTILECHREALRSPPFKGFEKEYGFAALKEKVGALSGQLYCWQKDVILEYLNARYALASTEEETLFQASLALLNHLPQEIEKLNAYIDDLSRKDGKLVEKNVLLFIEWIIQQDPTCLASSEEQGNEQKWICFVNATEKLPLSLLSAPSLALDSSQTEMKAEEDFLNEDEEKRLVALEGLLDHAYATEEFFKNNKKAVFSLSPECIQHQGTIKNDIKLLIYVVERERFSLRENLNAASIYLQLEEAVSAEYQYMLSCKQDKQRSEQAKKQQPKTEQIEAIHEGASSTCSTSVKKWVTGATGIMATICFFVAAFYSSVGGVAAGVVFLLAAVVTHTCGRSDSQKPLLSSSVNSLFHNPLGVSKATPTDFRYPHAASFAQQS